MEFPVPLQSLCVSMAESDGRYDRYRRHRAGRGVWSRILIWRAKVKRKFEREQDQEKWQDLALPYFCPGARGAEISKPDRLVWKAHKRLQEFPSLRFLLSSPRLRRAALFRVRRA